MAAKVGAAAALLLLLLTITLAGAEAKLCEERSQKFRGPCKFNTNCVAVCVTEGYTGGYCHKTVFHSHCMCTKECGGGGG
ncbi:hypothetical protein BRADI_3g05330v3, partial [Brachypodium distachyon]